MIRVATEDDIPRMLELGRQLHDESRFSVYPLNEQRTIDFFKTVINGGSTCAFVSIQKGEIVGGFMGGVSDHWSCDFIVAFDYSLFIDKAHRNGTTAIKLIVAFEAWAQEMGADETTIGITTGVNTEGTTRLYESLGYKQVGPMFTRRNS